MIINAVSTAPIAAAIIIVALPGKECGTISPYPIVVIVMNVS